MTIHGKFRIIIKLYRGVAQLVARLVRVQEAVGSTPATPTMRSVIIGFEYPVTDTPHFYFPQSSYSDLCRGVADSYAFSRFHDDVGLGNVLAVRHIESTDAVVVDDHLLIGHTVLLFGVVHINVVN